MTANETFALGLVIWTLCGVLGYGILMWRDRALIPLSAMGWALLHSVIEGPVILISVGVEDD